jgi:hypothetical protein
MTPVGTAFREALVEVGEVVEPSALFDCHERLDCFLFPASLLLRSGNSEDLDYTVFAAIRLVTVGNVLFLL